MNKTKAVVIFSGGQDSTTCLFWALQNFDEVYPITFNYGQKHDVEVEKAWKIVYDEMQKTGSKIKIGSHKFIDISFLKELSASELVKADGDLSLTNEKGLPSSFVPNRNQLFITISHAYAQMVGAGHLVTGVCETDYSGYPDCRKQFIDSIARASNIGSKSDITICTPLMNMNKAETFKLAETLGCLDIVLEHSHTCYNGDHDTKNEWGYGCGTCPACELRKKGWEKYLEIR